MATQQLPRTHVLKQGSRSGGSARAAGRDEPPFAVASSAALAVTDDGLVEGRTLDAVRRAAWTLGRAT